MLAVKKHPAFREDPLLSLDRRAFAITLLKSLPMWEIPEYLYPRMYALHNMEKHVALKDEHNRLPMPPCLHLSGEMLSRDGAYLVNNGQELILYVARGVSNAFCEDLFAVSGFEGIPDGQSSLPRLKTELNTKVRNLVNGLRNCHPARHMMLKVIREDSRNRGQFLSFLVRVNTYLAAVFWGCWVDGR